MNSMVNVISSDLNHHLSDFKRVNGVIEIIVEKNVKTKIIETEIDRDIHVVITMHENSNLEYASIIQNRNNSRIFNLERFAKLNTYYVNTSKINNLNEVIINLNDEGAEANVDTLDVANGTNKHLNEITINHLAGHTSGKMSNNAVGLGESKITFVGTNKIVKDMFKSVSRQDTRGIIMDETAKIEADPILLIDCFDCVAGHGAAIGKISDEGMFYLMSRGINRKDALTLVVSGFVNPIVDKFDEELKEALALNINNIIRG